jgi:phosphate transport system protein
VINMARPLDQGTTRIKSLVIKMGKLTEESLKLAMDGFTKKEDVSVQVKAWSNTILILSEEVEDRATELIALQQPMAGDLRTLKAYIKIAYDIERYSRYALDISDILNRLEDWPVFQGELKLGEMRDKTIELVSLSVQLIQKMDEKLIFELSRIEADTDELYLYNLGILAEAKKADPKTVIAYTLTVRYLERIADHASYIAESLTYAATGKRMALR